MTETIVDSLGRLKAFYITLFEKLNQQFRTGHSMAANIGFQDDILVRGEMFLDSRFWILSEGKHFDDIYGTVITGTYWMSLRGLHSKADLSSEFFSFYALVSLSVLPNNFSIEVAAATTQS